MRHATISGAAVLLASAPFAVALGSATLVNGCDFEIFYAPISGTAAGMVTLPPGQSYSSQYGNEGQGVSIKVSPHDDLWTGGAITQFEYTWAAGVINFDISNIDGNPFADYGMILSPSVHDDPSHPTCVPVECPAGEAVCAAAYNLPDDVRTMVCDQESNLVMTICSAASSTDSQPSSNGSTIITGTPLNNTIVATVDGTHSKREASHSEPQMLHSHHQRAHMRHFPRK